MVRPVKGGHDTKAEEAQLTGGKRRIFPVHFAPGKKLFHIVVKLSDAPGSYSSILNLLSTRVNLIGTGTYTLSDGTAMFSGFAEGLSGKETPDALKKLILGSEAAIAAKVNEGVDGLLVDTFHTGFAVGNDPYMLMRREGLGHMFSKVSRILGSGGDALLYEEGLAMGLKNTETMVKTIGAERVRAQLGVLNRFLSAQGWGDIEAHKGPGEGEFTVIVRDCFECTESPDSRKGCNFMRGYLVGSAKVSFGKDYTSVETKCVLRRADCCEFRLTPKE